ncbi:MAG: glycosyltransferase [Actinomycetaceae bacterium]|nr:glycosyltransferase [Actinomycetaceae bacterium]
MGLMVTRIFAPESAAAALRLSVVRKALTDAGYTMRVLTTKPGKPFTPDPLVKRLPVLRRDGYVKGYLSYLSFDLQAFAHLLAGKKPQFLLVEPPPTTGVVARVAAKVRRVPYFWYAADVWSDATESMEVPTIVKRAVRAMESFAISGARGVIAVSEDVAAKAYRLGAQDVRVVSNGADTDSFNLDVKPVSPSEQAKIGIKKPFFLYAGNASHWHGAQIFAHAVKEVPGVQLLYLARGDNLEEVSQVAQQIKEENPHLDYDPIVVSSLVDIDVAASWQRAAIACLASLKPGSGYEFAYTTKALSSLACGTPVIYAGPGPAADEIRTSGLGQAVAYEVGAVSQAMRQMLTATPDRKRLHQWVVDNRSMQATGRAVAKYIGEKLAQ